MQQSMAQWRYVFMITAALGVITTVIFTLFGSGDAQSWNEPDVAKAHRQNRRILKTKNAESEPGVTQPLQKVV
jgi:sugar phosphate permease